MKQPTLHTYIRMYNKYLPLVYVRMDGKDRWLGDTRGCSPRNVNGIPVLRNVGGKDKRAGGREGTFV